MPRRPAMRRRCSSTRQQRAIRLPSMVLPARLPLSTRGRCDSPRAWTPRREATYSIGARTRATWPATSTRRSMRRCARSPITARPAIAGARGTRCVPPRDCFVYVGRTDEALKMGLDAVRALEQLPPTRELALAYCNVSHLYMHQDNVDETRQWADRALEIADDPETRVYGLTNVGTIEAMSGRGAPLLEQALDLALKTGIEEHTGRAYVALTWWSPRGRRYRDADRYLDPGIDYCSE